MKNPPENLAGYIEHTILRSDVIEEVIRAHCSGALTHGFYGVVVNPIWVRTASVLLAGSPTRVVSVCGFPLGANRTDVKVAEAVEAAEDGAHEIDMVANIGWLCSDRFVDVEAEIRKVRRNLPANIGLKVIIEANLLSAVQQQNAVRAIVGGSAQFVKTGTGFHGGVTVEQVRLLVDAAGGQIGVKASSGIRNLPDCFSLLEAGAVRLGTSASMEIMAQYTAAVNKTNSAPA